VSTTIIAEERTNVEYDRHTRHWRVWKGDYANAKIIGAIATFPAGNEGRRGAWLSALTNDAPEIAAEVEAIIENRPQLTDRAIKGGQLVAAGSVELLHLNHYRLQSQSRPQLYYIVSMFQDPPDWHCQCEDWHNGHAKHVWKFERKTYAPWIPGIGATCKHVLACIISQATIPYKRCPECNGKCYTGFVVEATGYTVCKPCQHCAGTGAVLADPDEDMSYYEEKIQADDGEPVTCPQCNGEGGDNDDVLCPMCSGIGTAWLDREDLLRLEVR
jgi:hypothetical protein